MSDQEKKEEGVRAEIGSTPQTFREQAVVFICCHWVEAVWENPLWICHMVRARVMGANY